MTDIMKLIDDVIDYNASDERPRAALQSAIEALQGENERQKRQEIERLLRIETKVDELIAERDALQAKLDERQRQEPVNVWQLAVDDELVSAHLGIANSDATRGQAKAKVHELICWSIQVDKDLAAPKALEPLMDDAIWKNDALMSANSGYGATFETLREIVRAVEAAHGITKGTPT